MFGSHCTCSVTPGLSTYNYILFPQPTDLYFEPGVVKVLINCVDNDNRCRTWRSPVAPVIFNLRLAPLCHSTSNYDCHPSPGIGRQSCLLPTMTSLLSTPITIACWRSSSGSRRMVRIYLPSLWSVFCSLSKDSVSVSQTVE